MRKLLINGLLALVFVIIIIALFSALMNLRATDETDAGVDSLDQKQQSALSQEKAVVEQTAVTVSVSNGTTNATKNATKTNTTAKTTSSTSKSTSSTSSTTKKTSTPSSDADVTSFLNG
ncbi:hypothetical protein HZA99_01955 [Candidatus Woesearchaeota archaeon]|nr:hypothetical protein [Candidatus Woesearchaeota archaeon]